MDYSAANTELWHPMLCLGTLAGMMLFANLLLRKVDFIRKTLTPTAVLAGFLLLLLRELNVVKIDADFLEKFTYHAIALGFIALALRVPNEYDDEFKKDMAGLKSGAIIIGSYLIQGIVGMLISITLAYTFIPGMFKAAGILLPMGYGQGPGQANNIGSLYQSLGFEGGYSFALSLAAAGYLCACTVGVIYLNYLRKKGKLTVKSYQYVSGSVTVDTFQAENELPISESVDRFSMQIALIALVYLLAYLVSLGITRLLSSAVPGLAKNLNSIVWGFNFVLGSVLAMLCRSIFKYLTKKKFMTRQYQNNYLLNRISGAAFDLMIICGIGAIKISDLTGLWLPFLLMAVTGCTVTLFYLKWACKKAYKGYYYEGFFSMFGMMTGTISSGVLLLREIDPDFRTPAANNLLTGSSFAILLGFPMLIFVGLAPQSDLMIFITLGLMVVYFIGLALLITKLKRK